MSMTRNEILIALADGKALEVLKDGKWNDVCHTGSSSFTHIVEWADRHTKNGEQFRIKRTPREWWVNKYTDGLDGRMWLNEESAKQAVEITSTFVERIHVREVLE